MTHAIAAKNRQPGTADTLRADLQVPAVLYGPDMTPLSISLSYQTFATLYGTAGDSSLIDVSVEGQTAPIKTLIQEVQYDPVSGRITHVDFRQINMKKEMKAPVEIVFVGEAPAAKELGGTLVKALSVLNVKCLPTDLVGHIEVNISTLKTFADVIRVSDVNVPAGMSVLDNPNTTLAKVLAPLTEDQLKAMEEGTGPKSLEDIEVEEKGKKEETDEAGTDEAADKAAPTDKAAKKE